VDVPPVDPETIGQEAYVTDEVPPLVAPPTPIDVVVAATADVPPVALAVPPVAMSPPRPVLVSVADVPPVAEVVSPPVAEVVYGLT
jgi:hypothetical protein